MSWLGVSEEGACGARAEEEGGNASLLLLVALKVPGDERVGWGTETVRWVDG